MADRTVKVRLEADVSNYVTNVGGKAVAATAALDAEAKKANASIDRLGKGGSFETVGKKATATSEQVSKVGVAAETSGAKVKASAAGASQATEKLTESIGKSEKATTSASKATTEGAKSFTVSSKNADNYASALGRLRVAQLRLTETQNRKGTAGSSGLAGAEESVAAAERAVKKFEKVGNDSGKSFGSGIKKWFAGDGANVFKELGKNTGGGILGSIAGAIKTPVIGPILLTVLSAAVATVLPAVGALAAGALITGFGAGLAGLGVFFAAKSGAVRDKWSAMLTGMGQDLSKLSRPFETVLTHIADYFQRTFNDFKPVLGKAFADLAEPVDRFANDALKALDRFAPAFAPIVAAAGQALTAFGGALPAMIASIADGFTNLAQSVAANPTALADTAKGLGDIVGAATGLLVVLNNINGEFSNLTGGTSLVKVALDGLAGLLTPLTLAFTGLDKALSALGLKSKDYAAAVDITGKSQELWTQGMTAAQLAAMGLGAAAGDTGSQVQTLAEKTADTKKKMADAKAATDAWIASLFQLQGLAQGLAGAQISYQAAIDATTASIKANGRTHDISNAKGRANKQSLLDLSKAANDQTESMLRNNKGVAAASDAAAAARANFISLAEKMKYTKEQAIAMADAWLTVPKKVDTKVTNNAGAGAKPAKDATNYAAILRGTLPKVPTLFSNNAAATPRTAAERYGAILRGTLPVVKTAVVNNAPLAQSKIDSYRSALGLLPPGKSTKVSTPGAVQSQGQVGGLLGLLGALPSSKSVTINTYKNLIETTTHNDVGVRAPAAPGHADGGKLGGSSPNPKADNMLFWGTAGEWVQPNDSVDYYGPGFMQAVQKKQFPKSAAQGYANGGQLGHYADGGFLPGGKLVDVAYLLRQLGIPFNPSAGVNYGSTLAAQNKANSLVGSAKTAATRADAGEVAAKAAVARIQRAITLQQRYVAELKREGASKAKIAAEQKQTIGLQDQLYRARQRVTAATAAASKANALLKTRTEAATKATEAHKAAVQALVEQQKAAVDMAKQIADGLTASANIGDLFQNSLTGKGLLADLQAQGAQTGVFRGQVDKLRKQGLSEDLIQQIIGKGAEQGGEVAQAILDGGQGLVNALNKAEKALDDQANLIGAGSANKKYGQTIAGARADGGDVMAGKTYKIGERGTELWQPGVTGRILPHQYVGMAGGGTTTHQYHYQLAQYFTGVSMAEADLIGRRSLGALRLAGRR